MSDAIPCKNLLEFLVCRNDIDSIRYNGQKFRRGILRVEPCKQMPTCELEGAVKEHGVELPEVGMASCRVYKIL